MRPECHRGTLVIKAVSVHYLLLWSSRLICFTCLVSCQCPHGTLLTTLVFNSSTLPVFSVVNVPVRHRKVFYEMFGSLLCSWTHLTLNFLGHNLSSVATNFSDLLLPVIKLVCSGQCLVIQCLH